MKEKEHEHHSYYDDPDGMTEFEKHMALQWGTPRAVVSILLSLAIFLLAIGVFLWLLHLANIIK